MLQVSDFQTIIRKKLAYQTARLWVEEIDTTTIHLFTKEYGYVTLLKTFARRCTVSDKQKRVFVKLLAKEIEKELKLNSKFHLCQKQVPDKILSICYDKTGINFDVILPNTYSVTDIGNKNIVFFVNNIQIFSKKITL